MEIDRNGLEVLDRSECLALLRQSTLGRVALTSGALPTILPVNFALDGERILIRTGDGSKLDAALRDAIVAFEVDDFEPFGHSGWSVVVTGVASVIDEEEAEEVSRVVPVARWAPTGDSQVMSISTDLITGRRLAPGKRRSVAAHRQH